MTKVSADGGGQRTADIEEVWKGSGSTPMCWKYDYPQNSSSHTKLIDRNLFLGYNHIFPDDIEDVYKTESVDVQGELDDGGSARRTRYFWCIYFFIRASIRSADFHPLGQYLGFRMAGKTCPVQPVQVCSHFVHKPR